jgi:AAA+ ATPase superfamily predicted ATPase
MVRVDRIGRWWSKGEEIDLVGLNEEKRQIVFGEAKWSNKLVGLKVYEELKRKATLVEWNKGEREEYFVLFSKNGFTSALKKLAKKEKLFLVKKNKLMVK